jgi:hypothetical protein
MKSKFCLVIAISVVLAISSCSSGAHEAATGSSPTSAIGSPFTSVTASPFTRGICVIIQSHTAGDAAKELLKVISHGEFAGGLAADIVISAVQDKCTRLLSSAVSIVQRFFSGQPQETGIANVSQFQTLSDLPDSAIATQLQLAGYQNVSSRTVDNLVQDLCNDLRGTTGSNPTRDIQILLPNANLSSLQALNGVAAQVTRTCSLNKLQSDSLVSSIFTYLLSNQRLGDVTPPVVFGPTWKWVGTGEIMVMWDAIFLDGGSYDLWISDNGVWEPLLLQTTITSTPIDKFLQGHSYAFAIQATDRAGNKSPWSYLYPCWTCSPSR